MIANGVGHIEEIMNEWLLHLTVCNSINLLFGCGSSASDFATIDIIVLKFSHMSVAEQEAPR